MKCSLRIRCLVSAFLVSPLALLSAQPITTTTEYLEAMREVNHTYHGDTVYLGSGYAWHSLRRKLEGLLAIEDRVSPDAKIEESLRPMLSIAALCDLHALAIADSQKKVWDGSKHTPVEGLDELTERIQALDTFSEFNVKGAIGQTLGKMGPFRWKQHAGLRASTGSHDKWNGYFEVVGKEDKEVAAYADRGELADPFWQFIPVGIPNIVDHSPELPELEKLTSPEKLSTRNGPAEIRIDNLSGNKQITYEVDTKPGVPLKIEVEAEKGAFGVIVQTVRAWSQASNPNQEQSGEELSGKSIGALTQVFVSIADSSKSISRFSGRVILRQ